MKASPRHVYGMLDGGLAVFHPVGLTDMDAELRLLDVAGRHGARRVGRAGCAVDPREAWRFVEVLRLSGFNVRLDEGLEKQTQPMPAAPAGMSAA